MSKLTLYLARLIGVLALVLDAAFLMRGNSMIKAAIAAEHVTLIYAIQSLAVGLAIILGHNVWSGGLLPVTVTAVGWLIFAKALLLLFVPHELLLRLLERMQYGEHLTLSIVPSLISGLYLTYAGFGTRLADAKPK